MSSSGKNQKQILRKVICKPKKTSHTPVNVEQRMTRFKSKAKICGICYSPIETQGILSSCQHEFCFTCIEKWSQTENTCPLCKQRFSKLKKIWNRPFYGKKQSENSDKNLPAPDSKQEEEKEITVPTRNQRQSTEGPNLLFVEQLLNIMLNSLTRSPGRGSNFQLFIHFRERRHFNRNIISRSSK